MAEFLPFSGNNHASVMAASGASRRDSSCCPDTSPPDVESNQPQQDSSVQSVAGQESIEHE